MMIDYARMLKGQVPLMTNVFSLPELLSDVVNIMAPKAATQGVEILVIPCPSTPHQLAGDSTRLLELLCAVMENAVQFSFTGGSIYLRVWADDVVAGTSLMHFEIQDKGQGMDESTLRCARKQPVFSKRASANSLFLASVFSPLGLPTLDHASAFNQNLTLTLNLTLILNLRLLVSQVVIMEGHAWALHTCVARNEGGPSAPTHVAPPIEMIEQLSPSCGKAACALPVDIVQSENFREEGPLSVSYRLLALHLTAQCVFDLVGGGGELLGLDTIMSYLVPRRFVLKDFLAQY